MSATTSGWTVAAIKRAACWKSKVSCMTGDVRMGGKTYGGPGGVYVTISRKLDEHSPRVYYVQRFDPVSCRIEGSGTRSGYELMKHAASEAERLAACL